MISYIAAIALLVFALPCSFVIQYVSARNVILRNCFSLGFYAQIKPEGKLAACIYLVLLVVLPFMTALRADGVLISIYWFMFVGVTCLTLTAMLGWKKFRIGKHYKKHNKLYNLLGAATGLLVSIFVSALVDDLISQITTTEAATFPVAQKGMTVVISIAVWMLVVSAAGLFGAMGIGLWTMLSPEMSLSKTKTRFMGQAIKETLKKKMMMNFVIILAILYGLIASMILILEGTTRVLSSTEFDKVARELIVFSSFHLPASSCGLTTPDKTRIVQIRYKYAVVAIPDVKSGYEFSMAPCRVQLKDSVIQ
jgi:hypothetical protein